jgi:phage repressor protein C with HTH and peptisase S24 domain
MDQEDPRDALRRIAQDRRESLAGLSRLIGRNDAYLQQYVSRGTPVKLEANDRRKLAEYLRVDEELLGGPPSDLPKTEDMVGVRLLSVEAAAGLGRVIEGEFAVGKFRFDRFWLRQISHAEPEELSIISFVGDSMAPTINNGDEGLVDHSTSGRRVRDGIYVLRRDETLMVKRLAVAPRAGTVMIISDNPAYPTWPDCPLDSIDVLGRVVWIGRKLV